MTWLKASRMVASASGNGQRGWASEGFRGDPRQGKVRAATQQQNACQLRPESGYCLCNIARVDLPYS